MPQSPFDDPAEEREYQRYRRKRARDATRALQVTRKAGRPVGEADSGWEEGLRTGSGIADQTLRQAYRLDRPRKRVSTGRAVRRSSRRR